MPFVVIHLTCDRWQTKQILTVTGDTSAVYSVDPFYSSGPERIMYTQDKYCIHQRNVLSSCLSERKRCLIFLLSINIFIFQISVTSPHRLSGLVVFGISYNFLHNHLYQWNHEHNPTLTLLTTTFFHNERGTARSTPEFTEIVSRLYSQSTTCLKGIALLGTKYTYAYICIYIYKHAYAQ